MENKKIVILGGGESGVGAALLAKEKGFDVFVSDKGKITEKVKMNCFATAFHTRKAGIPGKRLNLLTW